jgi:hypothetical protein
MNMSIGLNLFLIGLFSFIISSNLETLGQLLLINAAGQMILFILVAAIPFLRTKRVS